MRTLLRPRRLRKSYRDTQVPNCKNGSRGEVDWLLTEYHHHVTMKESHFDSIITTASIGYTAAFAIATVVSTTEIKLPPEVFWLIPLSFVLLFAIVIQFLYRIVLDSYYLRELEERISSTTRIEFFHFEKTQARALFSIKTGLIPLLVTYTLLFIVSGMVYGGLIVVSYRGLDVEPTKNHLTPFLIVTLSLGAFMIFAMLPVLKGFEGQYSAWIRTSKSQQRNVHSRGKWLLIFRYLLIPRVMDFVAKSVNFWGAVILTLYLVYDSRISIELNSLGLLWIPLWVYLIIDLGAKQSTYIWNEIRDVESDRLHWDKKNRPLARLPSDMIPMMKIAFVVRAIITVVVSLAFSAKLGIWWLPLFVVLIYMGQVFYDRVAKPAGGAWRLITASVGYAFRWIPGSLAILYSLAAWSDERNLTNTNFDLSPQQWTALVTWGILFSSVFLAGYWWAETEKLEMEADETSSIPAIQSWFVGAGERSVRVSALLLFPMTFALASTPVEMSNGERLLFATLTVPVGVILVWLCDRILGIPHSRQLKDWVRHRLVRVGSTESDLKMSAEDRKTRSRTRFEMTVGALACILIILVATLTLDLGVLAGTPIAFVAGTIGVLCLLITYEHNHYEYLMLKMIKYDLMEYVKKLDILLFGRPAGSQHKPENDVTDQ